MARRGRQARTVQQGGVSPPRGGAFQPLSAATRDAIIDAAFEVLARTGMGDCPPDILAEALRQGAVARGDRLCFPRVMVERAVARATKRVSLPGFDPAQGLTIGSGHVHIGTGGAAVEVPEGNGFRPSALRDLYQLMTLVGRCDPIHYGVRPLVARDLDDPRAMDLHTAYACMVACPKPIGISFDSAAHLPEAVRMFDMGLGTPGAFRRQPFCFGVIVHAVSPLRYAPEGVAVMQEAITHGMPVQICTAAQAGATSPVTLAGALTQGLAEALAGLMISDILAPGHPTILAFMPFISDLRTGAMTGGGGEAAVANAAAAQLLLHLDLPATVSAGMTDAKIPDAQAGYEKGYTVALAAQAGADMINLSVGMLASLMVASPEALVLDADMAAAILRSVRGVSGDPGDIDLDLIHHVATGPGHYLGEAQTLARMKTDYVYPDLADRSSVQDWQAAGRVSILSRASARVAELAATPPTHLPADRAARICAAFHIDQGKLIS